MPTRRGSSRCGPPPQETAQNSLPGDCNFFRCAVLGYTDREYRDDHMAANHRYMILSRLSRRPVLIAMMVYSVAYGAATFVVWRAATSISNHRSCEKHYLVQSSAQGVGGEIPGLGAHAATRHLLI
jgi:hypothetical protein